jgi:tetratricopeptide (TPR) repeat protein
MRNQGDKDVQDGAALNSGRITMVVAARPDGRPDGPRPEPSESQRDEWRATADSILRLVRSDPRLALERATEWLAREQERGSAEGMVWALWAQAQGFNFSGRYDEAIARYEDAEVRFKALGLPAEAARTQIGHVTALRYKGRYQEAVELGIRSRQFFVDIGDDLSAAKQAQNLATLYRPMGRLRDAVRANQNALAILRRLDQRLDMANVEQNLGNALADLGQYDEALRYLRSAERIRRRLGLQSAVAQSLVNIGILSYRRGEYGQSLNALTDARQIYEVLKDDRSVYMTDFEILPVCIALNLREESAAAAERAIDGLRRFAVPFELAQALLWAGHLAATTGDAALARARTAEARELFGQLGNRLWEAQAQLQEASLVTGAGPDAEAADEGDDSYPGEEDSQDESPVEGDGAERDARAAADLRTLLDGCRLATQSLEQAGAVDKATFGLLVEGAMLARLGDADAARACYEQARDAAERLNVDHLLFQAHEALGALLESAEPDAAVESYRRAVDHLEAVRSRAVTTELKVAFLTDKADVYERIVSLLIQEPTGPSVAEAYRYVERSKSRALLDDLMEQAPGAAGKKKSRASRLEQRVRDLRAQLSVAYLEAYANNMAPSDDSLTRSGKDGSIADLESALARASRQLELAGGGQHAPQQHQDQAALAETPLPDGDVLIEYYSIGAELVAFVRRGTEVELRSIAAVDEVEALVDKLDFQIGKCALGLDYVMENLDKLRKGIDRCLQQLYRQIIGPVKDLLRDGDRLIVVPHGALHGLPFHAFHDGERYLVDRHVIAVAPSAAVMQTCRQAARPIGERAMVVGIDDPGLPSVPREVEVISATWPSAQVAVGPRATSRVLHRSVGSFDVLHLATHGVFRADNPSFSSIKLTDAWLTVRDLAEVARGAQLVTLSACETGVSGITAGDEVIGLTRGLLSAGCSAVVASLWTVSDESTARLMERFYASLKGGAAPAVALREAMLEIRQQYDHPYFWAPFLVTGDGLTSSPA